jgi:hypothetical protein
MANLQTDKVDLGDWLPLSSAPRDNTLLLLLVSGGENMTEDAQIWITIGGNSLEHTGEDAWKMAGWDWCFDQFTVGDGKPIGWLPLPMAPALPLRSAAEVIIGEIAPTHEAVPNRAFRFPSPPAWP